jgi:hypothetical protein
MLTSPSLLALENPEIASRKFYSTFMRKCMEEDEKIYAFT